MGGHDKTIFIPPWRQLPEILTKGTGKIQKNPSHAVAENQSRNLVRNILLGTGAVLVLIVATLSRISQITNEQKVSVSASVNLKQALYGKVEEVIYGENGFILIYESSLDNSINDTKIIKWKIYLPPGESIATSSKVCFKSHDLYNNLSNLVPGLCQEVIKPGSDLIVEYTVLDPQNQMMVAKKIIGK